MQWHRGDIVAFNPIFRTSLGFPISLVSVDIKIDFCDAEDLVSVLPYTAMSVPAPDSGYAGYGWAMLPDQNLGKYKVTYRVTTSFLTLYFYSEFQVIEPVESVGYGSVLANVIVIDSEARPVGGVELRVYARDDVSFTTVLYRAYTDSLGKRSFNINEGLYTLMAIHPSYYFSNILFETVLPGPVDISILANSVPQAPPPEHGLSVVYGRVRNLSLLPVLNARVVCSLVVVSIDPFNQGAGYQVDTVINPDLSIQYTNELGSWQMSLVPNSELTPTGTSYEFKVYKDMELWYTKYLTLSSSDKLVNLECP